MNVLDVEIAIAKLANRFTPATSSSSKRLRNDRNEAKTLQFAFQTFQVVINIGMSSPCAEISFRSKLLRLNLKIFIKKCNRFLFLPIFEYTIPSR